MKENLFPEFPILIINDNLNELESYIKILQMQGITNVIPCSETNNFDIILSQNQYEMVLLELMSEEYSGYEVLKSIKENYPHLPVIVITENIDLAAAAKCVRMGASDYIVKPLEIIKMVSSIPRVLELKQLLKENLLLKEQLLSDTPVELESGTGRIITANSKMKSIFGYIQAIATTKQPVLIAGETGVGKELIARSIYEAGGKKGKYIIVNVAGLDDNIFSDTLFGHIRGAYTGAQQNRAGLVEKASGGTLFLDEIGDLSIASQVKLLRLIQEGEYYPLGSDTIKRSDARLIFATNKDLSELHESGKFRKDLYFRLSAHRINIPPLRERTDDLPLLVNYFMEEAAGSIGKKVPAVTKELLDLLSVYHFPGNIRELRSMVYDALSSHTGGRISLEVFKAHMEEQSENHENFDAGPEKNDSPVALTGGKFPTIKEVTRYMISEAMQRSRGNQTIAAQLLGITQQALSSRLKRLK